MIVEHIVDSIINANDSIEMLSNYYKVYLRHIKEPDLKDFDKESYRFGYKSADQYLFTVIFEKNRATIYFKDIKSVYPDPSLAYSKEALIFSSEKTISGEESKKLKCLIINTKYWKLNTPNYDTLKDFSCDGGSFYFESNSIQPNTDSLKYHSFDYPCVYKDFKAVFKYLNAVMKLDKKEYRELYEYAQ